MINADCIHLGKYLFIMRNKWNQYGNRLKPSKDTEDYKSQVSDM